MTNYIFFAKIVVILNNPEQSGKSRKIKFQRGGKVNLSDLGKEEIEFSKDPVLGKVSENEWELKGEVLNDCIISLLDKEWIQITKLVFKSKNGTIKKMTFKRAMTLKDKALEYLQQIAGSQRTPAGMRMNLAGGDILINSDLCWMKSETEIHSLTRKKEPDPKSLFELKQKAENL